MNRLFLSTQSRTLSVHYAPVSMHIIIEYLKESILPEDNNLEIEINSFTAHEYELFNTFGSARLEILFYEKSVSGEGLERIVLYGIAENVCSKLKSFTLSFDTWWLDGRNSHAEDRYFDSVIVTRPGFSRLIPGSSLNLNLRKSSGILAAHCSSALRFESAHPKRAKPFLADYPLPSEVTTSLFP